MPELDPEQLAVLRLLKAAFGEVELLEVIDDAPTATLPAAQGWLFDGEGDDGLAPDEPQNPVDGRVLLAGYTGLDRRAIRCWGQGACLLNWPP